ncbi:MAG TPA: hypothetical protein VMU19_01270 [Bryobacteraceae bacterium]|nr:hypothetical protein [Bryobacteraceae bacterium]
MDLDLDPLKREILAYLDSSEFAVFHSTPGGLDGLPLVLWDVERFPDYRMFLDVARKAGVKVILFASCDLEASDFEELKEHLEEADLPREDQRDFQKRMRELRAHEGVTCSIELAFDFNSRMYVYELQPDWYDEFINLEEEIMEHIPDGDDDDDASLGGFYSQN